MSDHVLETLRTLLDRVHSSRDPSLALDSAALDYAVRLGNTIAATDAQFEHRLALGRFYWYRHLALPPDVTVALRAAVTWLVPCFVAGRDGIPEPLWRALAEAVLPMAAANVDEACTSGDIGLLSPAISAA